MDEHNSSLGFTIREVIEWNNDRNHKFIEILGYVLSVDSSVLYKARILNTNDETIIHYNSLLYILLIVSIPNEFEDVDIEKAKNSMSSNDLERLWK